MTNLLEQLQQQSHWQARYKLLLQAGKAPCPEDIRQSENKIAACTAATWLKACKQQGCYTFWVDSDSALIKALGLVLCQTANGKTAKEIARIELEPLLSSVDLTSHLSPSRANGVRAIWQHLQSQLKTPLESQSRQ